MATAKRFYTYTELTHRSTAQLIPIYNRLFNTNIWDEVFNPYEARQEILMALFAEMRAQEIVASYEPEPVTEIKPYKALVINVTAEGFVISWTADKPDRVNNRKFDEIVVREVHAMREAGISMRKIGQELGMPPSRVFRILKGWVYADVSA